MKVYNLIIRRVKCVRGGDVCSAVVWDKEIEFNNIRILCRYYIYVVIYVKDNYNKETGEVNTIIRVKIAEYNGMIVYTMNIATFYNIIEDKEDGFCYKEIREYIYDWKSPKVIGVLHIKRVIYIFENTNWEIVNIIFNKINKRLNGPIVKDRYILNRVSVELLYFLTCLNKGLLNYNQLKEKPQEIYMLRKYKEEKEDLNNSIEEKVKFKYNINILYLWIKGLIDNIDRWEGDKEREKLIKILQENKEKINGLLKEYKTKEERYFKLVKIYKRIIRNW